MSKATASRQVPMPGKTSLTCRQCREAFWMWPSDIKNGAGAFCSQRCYTASVTEPDHVCVECGLVFTPTARSQQLCSLKCRDAYIPKRTLARFWDNVDKTGECWLWLKAKDPHGYGRCGSGYADKVAWELTHGPIPDGLHLLHDCDNPPCVRPEPGHLHLGTHADNMAEASARRRFPYGEDWRRAHAGTSVKVTADDVRAIRTRYAAGGVTQRALGEEYGLSRSGISGILDRRIWKDIA